MGWIEGGFACNHADLAGVARSSLSSAAMAMPELGRPRASPTTPMQTCNRPRPRPRSLSHAHALPWTAPPPHRVKEEEVRRRRQWPDICVEQGAVRQGHDRGVLCAGKILAVGASLASASAAPASFAGDIGECDTRTMEFGDHDEYERQRARWKTDMEVHSSWQLSPVSVLELHSDEESLVHHALQALGP